MYNISCIKSMVVCMYKYSVASVDMNGEETPRRPTVRIGRHFVREERFNNSGTTSVSIESFRIYALFFLS